MHFGIIEVYASLLIGFPLSLCDLLDPDYQARQACFFHTLDSAKLTGLENCKRVIFSHRTE